MMASSKRLSHVYRTFILLFVFIEVIGDSENAFSSQEDVNKLAVANNDLAFKLYSRLANESPENVFFSPLSLSDAFGMLFIGTRGNTQQELRTALGYNDANLKNKQVPIAFNSYLSKVLSSNKNYTLDLANKLLLKKDIQIKPTYKQDVQNYFKADVEAVDFANNPKQIMFEVNAFVKEKTRGKISQTIDDVDPSTIMLLLNAIYFKGSWETEFKKKYTEPQKFYNNGLKSEAKDVPFMQVSTGPIGIRHRYTEIAGMQALELPYKGKDISMIFILPGKTDGLPELEKTLSLEKFKEFQNALSYRYVKIKIPKFKIEYSHEMVGDFEALGAKQIFTDAADLSGITPNKRIQVDSVFHKAIIEVNEEGSTAAALTAIRIIPASPGPLIRDPEFIADHPFIFAIVDKRYDMILFMGRVTEL